MADVPYSGLLFFFYSCLFCYSCPIFSPFALLRPAHPLLPQTFPTLLWDSQDSLEWLTLGICSYSQEQLS